MAYEIPASVDFAFVVGTYEPLPDIRKKNTPLFYRRHWSGFFRATGRRPLTGNKCAPRPTQPVGLKYLPDANQPPGTTTSGQNPRPLLGIGSKKRDGGQFSSWPEREKK